MPKLEHWRNWFVPGNTHNHLALYFLAFAKKEYSQENFFCWLAIEEYCGRRVSVPVCPSGAGPQQKLIFIYCTFLQKDAPQEVNTSRSKCDKVLKCLQDSRQDARSVLKDVQRDLETNISDTLSRFQFDKLYIDYCQSYDARFGTKLKHGLQKLDVLKLGKTFGNRY